MNITTDDHVITIDTSSMDAQAPLLDHSMFQQVASIYDRFCPVQEEVTVSVLAYNGLEKTKNCLEAILKYTSHLDYRLVLLDNGSQEEDIFGYFQEINHPKKTILRVTKNLGSNFGYGLLLKTFNTKFLTILLNDIVCTTHWLDNLLTCIKSDERIGWATPASSNVTNSQKVNLPFSTLEEMQEQAKLFNVSDPSKWEERLRLINVSPIIRKEVADRIGTFDAGYFHDFGEDDYCKRIRSLGYKIYVLKDTFVHHDHVYKEQTGERAKTLDKSISVGRSKYVDKYHIDPWENVHNFEFIYFNLLQQQEQSTPLTVSSPTILGIDVLSGTPILQLRNYLRKKHIFQSDTYALTSQGNCYKDLVFVTEHPDHVICGKVENHIHRYDDQCFDYILVGKPLEEYHDPIFFLKTLQKKGKKGSKIFMKISNPYHGYRFLMQLGYIIQEKLEPNLCFHPDIFRQSLEPLGFSHILSENEVFDHKERLSLDQPLQTHLSDPTTKHPLLVESICYCLVI